MLDLVLHPGSWKGLTRDEGLRLAAQSIKRAIDGLPWQGTGWSPALRTRLGQSFRWAGASSRSGTGYSVRPSAPVGVCLDTCHVVAGYDLVSAEGYSETMGKVAATVGFDAVRVWHCNDTKAERGSKLDRHEHIGQGTMGVEPFRRLLNDARFAHCAFIAETPSDETLPRR